MDQSELRGRRIKVAYPTASGGGSGSSGYGAGGGGYGAGGGYGNSSEGGDRDSERRSQRSRGDTPASQNLFVANIPPHIKMRELEEYFEQFGRGTAVKAARE